MLWKLTTNKSLLVVKIEESQIENKKQSMNTITVKKFYTNILSD